MLIQVSIGRCWRRLVKDIQLLFCHRKVLKLRDYQIEVDDKAFQDIQSEFDQFWKRLKWKGKKEKLRGNRTSFTADSSINSDVTSSRKVRKGKRKNKKYTSRKEDTKGSIRMKRKTMEEASKESAVERASPKESHITSEATRHRDPTTTTCSEVSPGEMTSDEISKNNEQTKGKEERNGESPVEARFCSE